MKMFNKVMQFMNVFFSNRSSKANWIWHLIIILQQVKTATFITLVSTAFDFQCSASKQHIDQSTLVKLNIFTRCWL